MRDAVWKLADTLAGAIVQHEQMANRLAAGAATVPEDAAGHRASLREQSRLHRVKAMEARAQLMALLPPFGRDDTDDP